MDINEIREYLPHRYPLLLLDRVLSIEPGKKIVAVKNVTINEEFFTGHFPHRPVMPGVLIIEALAQTAGVLCFKSHNVKADANSVYYLAGIDNARFKRPVEPGDQLILEAELIKKRQWILVYKVCAKVDGNVAAEAELICTVRPAK